MLPTNSTVVITFSSEPDGNRPGAILLPLRKASHSVAYRRKTLQVRSRYAESGQQIPAQAHSVQSATGIRDTASWSREL